MLRLAVALPEIKHVA